jgi:hypothetical protein
MAESDDRYEDQEIPTDAFFVAARSAFNLLWDCIEGDIDDATVADKISAAKYLLDNADQLQGLLEELEEQAYHISDEAWADAHGMTVEQYRERRRRQSEEWRKG